MYGDKSEEDLEVGGDIHPCLRGQSALESANVKGGWLQNAPPKSLRTTQGQGSRVCSKDMMMLLSMRVEITTGLAGNEG
jgi:hypothetical protein